MTIRRRVLAAATSVWLIFGVALACRVAFAWDQQRRIPDQALRSVPFLYEPGNIAYSLVTGHGYASPFHIETGPTAWEAPVYPLMLAGFFKVFGIYSIGAFAAAAVCNILFSSLACVPIFFSGRRVAGIGVGAGAAWLWAVFPNAVIIPFEWIWDTSLSALLAAVILWATLGLEAGERRAGMRAWCAYGLLWGFTLMVNPSFVLLMACLFCWLVWRGWRDVHSEDPPFANPAKSALPSSGLRAPGKPPAKAPANATAKAQFIGPAVAVVVAILCCVPWTVRNWIDLKSFVPLRSNLGLELWLGNNAEYHDLWPGWLHPIDNTAERNKYAEMGEIAYMREKRGEAIEFIETHPAMEARLFVRRVVTVWLGSWTPVKDFRKATRTVTRVALVSNFLATLGAIAGLGILFWRRNAYAWMVAAFPIVFPLPYYWTRPLLRYRHPIDPVVMLLCAVAIAAVVRRWNVDAGAP